MDSSLPVVYLKETKLYSLALPRAMNGDIDLLFGTQPEGNACSVMLQHRNKNSSLNRSKSKKVGTSLAKTKLSKTQAVLGPVQDLQALSWNQFS